MVSQEEARAIKRRHSPELLKRPGVSGVGVEKGEGGDYVLTIHVNADEPGVADQLPAEIEGLPVRIVRSGPYRKFTT
jgi:hypothetical protein